MTCDLQWKINLLKSDHEFSEQEIFVTLPYQIINRNLFYRGFQFFTESFNLILLAKIFLLAKISLLTIYFILVVHNEFK